MIPGTKLKKGKWYFLNFHGDNVSGGYYGKAKCIDPKVNYDYCGGSYMFMYYDPLLGLTKGAFALGDILYEMNKNDL